MTTEELLEQIRTKTIVVFGTGFVAERFWQALQRHHLNERISAFLVSKRKEEKQFFHGCPVLEPAEIKKEKELLVCLAVHETVLPEVRNTISPELAERSVWIYPNLWELLFGAPVERNSLIPREILLAKQNPDYNWISVRYMAIRDYLEGSTQFPHSADLYCHAISLHCGMTTAKRRLKALEQLAESIRDRGFDREMPILIDTSGRILDGLHRFASACYFGMVEIPCTVLPESEDYDRMLNEKNRIPDRVLREAGFSEDDLAMLRQAKQEILNGRR